MEGKASAIDKNKQLDEDVDIEEVDDELPENMDQMDQVDESDFKKKDNFLKQIFEIDNNIEAEFSLFDNFNLDKNNDGKIDENTLLGRIIKRDIVRTDVPSYLLGPELTFRPQKGIISKVQYYGAFQGDLTSSFTNSDYDTSYDVGFFK